MKDFLKGYYRSSEINLKKNTTYSSIKNVKYDLHYFQMPYLHIHLLTKIYWYPQNQYLWHVHSHLWGWAAYGEEFELPPEVEQNDTLPVWQLIICKKCVLNKVSLNRNTYKTRLCIDQLTKMLWPTTHRNLTLYFSKVFMNSLFAATL